MFKVIPAFKVTPVYGIKKVVKEGQPPRGRTLLPEKRKVEGAPTMPWAIFVDPFLGPPSMNAFVDSFGTNYTLSLLNGANTA